MAQENVEVPSSSTELREEIQRKIAESRTWKDMKIYWHSVAPYIGSGYGTVTKYFCSGFLNRGFPVFIGAYYGIQPGGTLNWKGLTILPVVKGDRDKLGFETGHEHYTRFGCDIGIFHADFWVSLQFAKLIPQSICYSPIDHENYPEKWLQILRAFKWVAVPSLHAQKELSKCSIASTFLPHGVNTDVFRPENKAICRKAFTIPDDRFVIGIVAANNDDEPRKGWDATFQAIKIFLDNNKEAAEKTTVFIHTDPENERGRNLIELSRQVGVEKHIVWNDRYTATILGLPETALSKLYNTFDIFLLLSRREGFCIPALEAQACGVPCILNNFSALTERNDYGRCGWLVKPAAMIYSPLNAITSIPDPYKAADALEEAYNSPSKREQFSKKSLAFAKRQTWELALDKFWMPFLEKVGDEIPGLSGRKEARKLAGN